MYEELIMFLVENNFQKIETKDELKESWKYKGKTIVNDLTRKSTGFLNLSVGEGNCVKIKINLVSLTKKQTLMLLNSIVKENKHLTLDVLSSMITKEKIRLYEES